MQENISGDAVEKMFVGRTLSILVYINYLAGVELGEICSVSVRHAHADQYSYPPYNYNAANEMQWNISRDAASLIVERLQAWYRYTT